MPPPLSSPVGPKRLPPPSRRQRSSSFPRPTRSHAHRYSRLTRQHGGEQSGLVTLNFDLLTLKVVSESHVTRATAVPILVWPFCSRLRPDVRDRQTDVRHHHRLMPQPRGRGHKKRSKRLKHCALAVVRRSQNFRPTTDLRSPLPGGAGRPKCNQLEMVTTFNYITYAVW